MGEQIRTNLEQNGGLAQRAILEPLQHLHDEVDRLIHDYVPKVSVALPWRGGAPGKYIIPVNVTVLDTAVEVAADVPGIALEDIETKLSNDSLIIKGNRRGHMLKGTEELLSAECDYGEYYRAIPMPYALNENKIEAILKDGVLMLKLPKAKEAKQRERSITVRSE